MKLNKPSGTISNISVFPQFLALGLLFCSASMTQALGRGFPRARGRPSGIFRWNVPEYQTRVGNPRNKSFDTFKGEQNEKRMACLGSLGVGSGNALRARPAD